MSLQIPVSESVRLMEELVRKGLSSEAEQVGRQAQPPLAVPKDSVQLEEKIAQGAESEVSSGMLGATYVAVKRPFLRNSADLGRFRKEIEMLSWIDHPNVVSLLGARLLPPGYFMVMPNMGDNLHSRLHDKGWKPDWPEVLDIGIQMASAIKAVHGQRIVHRDIKTKNVLQGNGGGVQVVDFGVASTLSDVVREHADPKRSLMSRGKPTGGFHKTKIVSALELARRKTLVSDKALESEPEVPSRAICLLRILFSNLQVGTLEYMAPEILLKGPCTLASDVYSFAVTLNEIATHVFPFSDCTKDNPDCYTVLEMGYGRQEISAAVCAEGLRPLLPSRSPPSYSLLLKKCWSSNPSTRPTIAEVLDELCILKYSLETQHDWHPRTPITLPPDRIVGNNPREAEMRNPEGTALQHRVLPKSLASMKASKGPKQLHKCMEEGGSYFPDTLIGAFASPGHRGEDRMEDRHLAIDSFMDSRGKLLGVYDGHRGSETAHAASERLPEIISDCFMSGLRPTDAFQASYSHFESEYERSKLWRFQDPKGPRYPGCTALTALIWLDKLIIANAGDSRAVLCRKGQPVQVTRDHTAMDKQERKRLESLQAQIAWTKDSWRVGKAGIQVTRSLGDVDLKSCGVTAEPEVTEIDLTHHDEFLVIASDGLWDSMSNEEVVSIVYDTVKQPEMCAKRLVTDAIARGSHDNVSVIVAYLKPVTTVEKIFQSGEAKCQLLPTAFSSGPAKHRSHGLAPDEVMETC